jgi:hypothetical protein
MNKQIINFIIDKIILLLFFYRSLLIIIRSVAIKLASTRISIIILFYILNKKIKLFKNKLVTDIIILFSFFFINSFII